MVVPRKNNNYYFRTVILFIALILCMVLYTYWHTIIGQIIIWQKDFHGLLATHINAISKDPVYHGFSLIALSFAYGAFHAIGPGHGKAVIMVYLGSHKESLLKGALISWLAALFQSVMAILLVVTLSKILSLKFSEINHYSDNITQVSYILVMGLGIFLFLTTLVSQIKWKDLKGFIDRINPLTAERKLLQGTLHNTHNGTLHSSHHTNHQTGDHTIHHERHQHENHHHENHHHSHGESHHEHHQTHSHDEGHHHSHSCCNGHHVDPNDIKDSWLHSIGLIFSMGIRPCTGAILVLIYAHLVGNFSYGLIATLAMGLGTGLAVSALALGTQLARNWFEDLAKTKSKPAFNFNSGLWLRMTGGVIIFLLGLSLFQAAAQIANDHPLI